MALIRTAATLYAPAKAEAIAAELAAADEDGWTYVAVHAPEGKGFSYIAIYDEDGQFVDRYGEG